MKKKIYQKQYTRYFPIYAMQNWNAAERDVLPGLFREKIMFEKMLAIFVHKIGRGSDVYYEKVAIKRVTKEFVEFFENNPMILEKFVKDSEKQIPKILDFCKLATIDHIPKLCKLISHEIWPTITVSFVMGDESKIKAIRDLAISLRKKNDTVLYTAHDTLFQLAKKKLPQFAKPKMQEYIDLLTIEEIVSGKVPNLSELEKRKEGFIYFEGRIITDKSIKDFEKENNLKLVDESLTELKSKSKDFDGIIKGSIACKGKVKGRVKLVFEINQARELKVGEILVSPMTTPDFISAMDKCAAIVTDEGGLTCHAAIVARELGKPCIIGTKIGTKVLKNGDLVEVDANKGVVRKLSGKFK